MSEFKHSIKVPRLYKDSSKILKAVNEGGSLKELVFNHNRFANIKGIHALVAECIRHDTVISRILENTNLLYIEKNFDPWLAKILTTELVFGKKRLAGDSKPILTILKYKEDILKQFDISSYTSSQNKNTDKVVKPRYVRVNTLKISLEDAILKFKEEGWDELECPDNYDEYLQLVEQRLFKDEYVFIKDFHIKNMLVFPSKVYFYDHPSYLEHYVILQDKASCLFSCCVPIKSGSIILDMCAGPGMKTMLMAACINNYGKIFAVEHVGNRCKTMLRLLNDHGVDCVQAMNVDAGLVGPDNCKNVKYILVDPSCSGSGMTSRIEDTEKLNSLDMKRRLQRLANVQGYLLRHAVSNFPTAKYVIYSTCSLEEEENEVVIESVLGCAKFHGFNLINIKKKLNGWRNFGSDKYECGKKCIYTRPENDLTNGGFLAIFKRKFKNDLSAFQLKLEAPKETFTERKVKLSDQFFVVVNTLKTSIEESIQFFVDNDWKYLPVPMSYDIFLSDLQEVKKRVKEKFFEQDFHIRELLLFPMGIIDELPKSFVKERNFILLDKVSCLAVHLLNPLPSSSVLHMCAGKDKMTLFTAFRMNNNGTIYAYDQDELSEKNLTDELRLCGVSCVQTKLDSCLYADSKHCPGVKLILVNPPCSGSGSGVAELSQYSFIKKTDNINKGVILRKYIVTQYSLLRKALTEFPEAERVVYVTHSVHPEENEEIINALLVLAKFNGFKLIDAPGRITSWTNEFKSKYYFATKCLMSCDVTSITKGFFIAVFERNKYRENELPSSLDTFDSTANTMEDSIRDESIKDHSSHESNEFDIKIVPIDRKTKTKGEKTFLGKEIDDHENQNSTECSPVIETTHLKESDICTETIDTIHKSNIHDEKKHKRKKKNIEVDENCHQEKKSTKLLTEFDICEENINKIDKSNIADDVKKHKTKIKKSTKEIKQSGICKENINDTDKSNIIDDVKKRKTKRKNIEFDENFNQEKKKKSSKQLTEFDICEENINITFDKSNIADDVKKHKTKRKSIEFDENCNQEKKKNQLNN